MIVIADTNPIHYLSSLNTPKSCNICTDSGPESKRCNVARHLSVDLPSKPNS
jgi:hypothetical protein